MKRTLVFTVLLCLCFSLFASAQEIDLGWGEEVYYLNGGKVIDVVGSMQKGGYEVLGWQTSCLWENYPPEGDADVVTLKVEPRECNNAGSTPGVLVWFANDNLGLYAIAFSYAIDDEGGQQMYWRTINAPELKAAPPENPPLMDAGASAPATSTAQTTASSTLAVDAPPVEKSDEKALTFSPNEALIKSAKAAAIAEAKIVDVTVIYRTWTRDNLGKTTEFSRPIDGRLKSITVCESAPCVPVVCVAAGKQEFCVPMCGDVEKFYSDPHNEQATFLNSWKADLCQPLQ